ncbi:MAG: hydrogenase formation protein HypD [Candidatus Omnitrophota bacterium]
MKQIKLMEVCGTHTMAIARAGIKKVLPKGIKLVSGPGCPVCVTDQTNIDYAIEVSRIKDVIMATFGDMLRVPGSQGSLDDIRREGYDVRVVYSCIDALKIAKVNPGHRVVFMGVGFETTAPTVAASVLEAERKGISNFFVLSNFKLVFPALEIISSSKRVQIDGFICPGHVSVITGSKPYEKIANKYKRPCVIMGFEPSEILSGISRLVKQVRNGEHKVEIDYKRAVKRSGNVTARNVLNSVFEADDAEWRGIGQIKKSGLSIRREYKKFDGKREFNLIVPRAPKPRGCICGDVLQGIYSPQDCKLFKRFCTPQRPVGPCMVSSEGTCAAYFKYGG